ncbi:MAG: MaoC family dehydratase [Rhodospirillaceae bacterium]|jgi:acyl dehydratase|nr:MaoC family dehydratase [Rhodospirillaceae bacterium]MBT5244960.1 MaoC family dehydratase [Rhodospirillaceae bacterium]MBT5562651.1 MaoC family dehydratase [Rhodospirillaceae bacterium]MBT6243041.1 MaoC family dehydratase [Rhodospirillaceae bacterium]MBT7136972.1 MaoC family dehydratase [Rhodospirillaceae bacterium]
MTSTSLFETPYQERFFEDYIEGMVLTFGSVTVNEAQIIDFAKRFDPQVYHIDPDGAKDTIYGGVIASGWHTGSLMMSMMVPYYLSDKSSMGSPGLKNLHWLAPVRPGDTLSVRLKITECRRSQSRPDRGIVKSFVEVLNQDQVVVMDFNAVNFTACRA